jgi:hypothetical protein
MPSSSATDSAPAAAGNMPVATTASHPRAASTITSNWAAITSAARSGMDDAAGAALVSARANRPIGTSGTPKPASNSAKSGGAHTSTSAPRARNSSASASIGSTSPRDPYVDNKTRIPRLPRLATGSDSEA